MSDEKDKLADQARALTVQKHQLNSAQQQLGQLESRLRSMDDGLVDNKEILDSLLAQAETLISASEITFVEDDGDATLIEKTLYVETADVSVSQQPLPLLDIVEIDDATGWEGYLSKVDAYATRNRIEFAGDPFRDLMSASQRIALEKRIKEEFSLKGAHCDKYDYMIAGTCGMIGGLLDVLFVGLPGQGPLTKFTDDLTDKAVQQFARLNGWTGPSKEGKDPTASAIGFLERTFKVNYDHRHGGDVGGAFSMSTKNHHIKSLAHSPDLVGLFFSILDQFTSTAHFVDNGRIIQIETETFELSGSSVPAKLFAGFVNWLGHLFSDVAGSSGAIERGSGLPMPFYSLLQFINVGEFGQHRQTFAKIAVQVFEQGYDLRHGLALAIPVFVTELLTRMLWTVKQRFYHQRPWGECVPLASNPELRRMLLIAHGSLCLVDTADAALRSGGDMIQFMLRSNLVAWARFGTLAMSEIQALYRAGSLDDRAVDEYLESECRRLLAV